MDRAGRESKSIKQSSKQNRNTIAETQETRIAERKIYIELGEILHLMEDPKLTVQIIDVRPESEYNLFHVLDAVHVPIEQVLDYASVLHTQPEN